MILLVQDFANDPRFHGYETHLIYEVNVSLNSFRSSLYSPSFVPLWFQISHLFMALTMKYTQPSISLSKDSRIRIRTNVPILPPLFFHQSPHCGLLLQMTLLLHYITCWVLSTNLAVIVSSCDLVC